MIDFKAIGRESEALYNAGDFQGSYDLLTDAVARYPSEPWLKAFRGQLLLLFGRWTEAWQDLLANCPDALELWMQLQMGRDLSGESVLLLDDAGRGDAVQNIRYAKQLADTGLEVRIQCRTELWTLLQSAPGVAQKWSDGPRTTYRCNLSHLPAVFGQQPNAELAGAYLNTNRRYAYVSNDLHVGICWAGNPSHGRTQYRDIPDEFFRSILAINSTPCHWLINQWGECPSWTRRLNGPSDDLSDLAVGVNELDLVITCDTAQAHLAGALGKPTWLLLSTSPDARWMLGRDDTPWYKSVRIFRQTTPGDWSTVFEQVAGELEKMTSTAGSAA